MRVCIFGSCVSRDIFNCARDNEIDIALYSARSSMGSIYAPRPFPDTYSSQLKSTFQRRVVGMDLRKEVIDKLDALDPPELVVVDLIDERFSLMEASSGGRFTLSVELQNILTNKISLYREIPSGSEEFLRHWTQGWQRFVEYFDSKNMLDRILINKVYWQTTTHQGKKFNQRLCKKANQVLTTMYQHQKQHLSPHQFIEYGNLLSCPDDHRCGPAPFHYTVESQIFALNYMRDYLTKCVASA